MIAKRCTCWDEPGTPDCPIHATSPEALMREREFEEDVCDQCGTLFKPLALPRPHMHCPECAAKRADVEGLWAKSPRPEVMAAIAWWRDLTHKQRMTVLMQASDHKHDPSATDAWMLWRAGVVETESDV